MRISCCFLLVAAGLLCGCTASVGVSPEDAFNHFRKAIAEKDYEGAWKLLTTKNRQGAEERAAEIVRRTRKGEDADSTATKELGLSIAEARKLDGREYWVRVMSHLLATTYKDIGIEFSRTRFVRAEVENDHDHSKVYTSFDGTVNEHFPWTLVKENGVWRVDFERYGSNAVAHMTLRTGGSAGILTFEGGGNPFFQFTLPGAGAGGPSGFSLPNAVFVEMEIKGLPQGSYCVHLHDLWKCEQPDYKTTGKYFASRFSDNEIFRTGADGVYRTNFMSNIFKLDSLFMKAIVIHAIAGGTEGVAPHDPETGPIVACGLIVRQPGGERQR
jgi:hypothetical protein